MWQFELFDAGLTIFIFLPNLNIFIPPEQSEGAV